MSACECVKEIENDVRRKHVCVCDGMPLIYPVRECRPITYAPVPLNNQCNPSSKKRCGITTEAQIWIKKSVKREKERKHEL